MENKDFEEIIFSGDFQNTVEKIDELYEKGEYGTAFDRLAESLPCEVWV